MIRRFPFIALAVLASAGVASAASPDRNALKFAGLSLGMPAAGIAPLVQKFGFGKTPPAADPALAQREAKRVLQTLNFRRGDGHALSVGIERDDTPEIRSLAYRMGKDIDTHARLFNYIRATYGPPHATHGGEDSLRILIWEIPGSEMTKGGLIATSIVLSSDPVEGHTLTLGEVVKRPEFTAVPAGSVPSAVISRE